MQHSIKNTILLIYSISHFFSIASNILLKILTTFNYLNSIKHKNYFGGIHMSDLSATQCGCGNIFGGGSCNNITWIILIILLLGGNSCGSFFGGDGCGCGGNNEWIIIIILLLFCGCGNGNNGCGMNSCCGCGC